jgi:hypothetical protein
MNEARIVEQLDRMVLLAGLTQLRLRSFGPPRARSTESVLGAIRAQHASPYLEAAVNTGEMTRQEAEDQLERLLR